MPRRPQQKDLRDYQDVPRGEEERENYRASVELVSETDHKGENV